MLLNELLLLGCESSFQKAFTNKDDLRRVIGNGAQDGTTFHNKAKVRE